MLTRALRKPRLQLSLLVFVLAAIFFWQARGALSPFILGLVIAYLILPLVNLVQRILPAGIRSRGMARPLAIGLVYLVGLLLLTAAIALVVPPLADQVVSLYENADTLYERGRGFVNEGLDEYQQISPAIRDRIEEQLQGFSPTTVLTPVFGAIRRVLGSIGNTLSFMVGLIVIPFWLFFVLNAGSASVHSTMSILPREVRPDVEAIRIIGDRVFSAYIRGQLLVAAALGTAIFIGLLLLRVEYALLLALAAAVLALIPFVGSILGAIPAIIVAFLQEPSLALGVVALFFIIQQIDNVFFSPKIVGDAVALHPAVIMVVIVVGSALYGIAGALLAVPIAAILRDVIQYFYIRLAEPPISPVDALTRVGYGTDVTPEMREAVIAKAQVAAGT